MIIDSTGVGIGTASPATQLHISGTANNTFIRIDDGSEFTNIGVDATGSFYNTNTNHRFLTASGGTEALRIDSTANVGIGNSSPSSYSSSADNLVVGTSGDTGITIVSGTVSNGQLKFADGTSGDATGRGIIDYNHSSDSMAFKTAATERMRIDSSGNLLVGKNATGGNTAGMQIIAGSFFSHVRDDGVVQVLNRKTSDGDILQFEKDNSTVGSIGTEGTDLTIGSGGAGFQFLESENKIRPFNMSTNSASNGVVDLGRSNAKFKDLYLSGAIKMDSDLDDYEEGTWTPSFQSDGSTSYSAQIGTYTKIGDLVTAWFHIDINSNGATGTQSLIIAGLPFAAASTSENYGSVTGMHCNQWSTSTKPDHALVSPSANVSNLYKSNGQAGLQIPTHNDIGGGNLLGCLIYKAS